MSTRTLAAAMILATLAACQNPKPSTPATLGTTKPTTMATTIPAPGSRPNLVAVDLPLKIDLGNNVALELILIKPGSFTMGSPADEAKDAVDTDETQHKVTLTKPFYLGKFEVTQAQWRAIMNANPALNQGDNLPVENITWAQATAFCQQLSTKTGKTFRLPTEAEWEYACRAGDTGPFQGAAAIADVAWVGFNDAAATSHPVGQKKPNAWGLHDMLGNVWEWCADSNTPYAGDATDPLGSAAGNSHINRGGSFNDTTTNAARAANRGRSSAQSNRLGLRVAMTVP